MLDKKINETIDILIKKIKDNNLGSIRLSNKVNSIEISNTTVIQSTNQNTLPSDTQNKQNEPNDSLIFLGSRFRT